MKIRNELIKVIKGLSYKFVPEEGQSNAYVGTIILDGLPVDLTITGDTISRGLCAITKFEIPAEVRICQIGFFCNQAFQYVKTSYYNPGDKEIEIRIHHLITLKDKAIDESFVRLCIQYFESVVMAINAFIKENVDNL